jgi:hypothetical protein
VIVERRCDAGKEMRFCAGSWRDGSCWRERPKKGIAMRS